MTQFEKYLTEKGWIKFTLNARTGKYSQTNEHNISSMGNLDHRYIHSTDTVLLQKIEQGKSVHDGGITFNDRKREICFGLSEYGKPPTLTYPRPRIEVKRIKNGVEVVENQQYDDSMNIVLQSVPFDEILQAMFNRESIIKITAQ